MNNNTKSRRSKLREARTDTSFTIPQKVSGNRGAEYSTRTQTIPYGAQPRKSERAKVCGRNGQ